MKKLNNRGYITVEILIASIIAAVIAVFLIELTVKLVSKTDDAYIDIALTTDKALIIRNIRENIERDIKSKGIVNNLECDTNTSQCVITFKNDDVRIIYINESKIKYCSDLADECTYEKELNSTLSDIRISNINEGIDEGKYVFIQIEAKNIFEEKDYTINIPILNGKIEEFVDENAMYTVTINLNGSYVTDGEVKKGETYSFSDILSIPLSSEPSIFCNKGNVATINRISKKHEVIVENVTANTICDITY